ncbi:MAG: DUF1294 domain-containing protein [Planctomycetota bacterium]|jgi:uncharacterized membrane protein YsdA (DUF1294 family)
MARHQPKKTFFRIAAILVAVLSILLWWLGLPGLYAYLIGINAVTILLYGYDKRQAIVGRGRVPEVTLHLAALVGGTGGALLAQGLLRHKTRKFAFRVVFVGIILLQCLVAVGYWYFVCRTA